MAVALVCVQIKYHKPLHTIPLLHVPCYECYVGVNTEAAALVASRVMETTT